MTYEERKQLDALSKLVYGKSSKWVKMVNKPEIINVERSLEDGTKQKYRTTSYYTVEEVKRIMEEIWKEEQERIAKEENKQPEVHFTEDLKGLLP